MAILSRLRLVNGCASSVSTPLSRDNAATSQSLADGGQVLQHQLGCLGCLDRLVILWRSVWNHGVGRGELAGHDDIPDGLLPEVRHDSDNLPRSIDGWQPKWQPSEPTTVDGYGPAEHEVLSFRSE
jgi:hypothetical protein